MGQHYWRRLAELSPEYVFLGFASFLGLALAAMIPPLAGGNEQFNFQRVATIASFHLLVEPALIPSGTKRLLDAAHDQFNPEKPPPYHYSAAEFDRLASIPLEAAPPTTLEPNPIAVLNPAAYIPQVAAYLAGEAFGLSPLALFYLGRLSGLAAAIGLTFLAIRRMPFRKFSLCALALLPTLAFNRTTLDADQVTNAICFLFIACVAQAASELGPISGSAIASLALIGFLAGQCKSAYLVLLALAFAIPAARYGSRMRWLAASLMIAAPGVLCGFAWMLALRHTYFSGIRYFVFGAEIYPDGQVAAILADPLGYAAVLARTIFLSPLLPVSLVGLIGLFGPPVLMPAIAYPSVIGAIGAVFLVEGAPQRASSALRLLGIAGLLSGFVLILTLLYIQWNPVGASIVKGFSGRYLYPLSPLILFFLPMRKIAALGFSAPAATIALGAIATFFTLEVTWATYLA
jgi:uncharacterized membrane protein